MKSIKQLELAVVVMASCWSLLLDGCTDDNKPPLTLEKFKSLLKIVTHHHAKAHCVSMGSERVSMLVIHSRECLFKLFGAGNPKDFVKCFRTPW